VRAHARRQRVYRHSPGGAFPVIVEFSRARSADRTLFGPEGPTACQITSASVPSGSEPTLRREGRAFAMASVEVEVQAWGIYTVVKKRRRGRDALKEGLSFRAT